MYCNCQQSFSSTCVANLITKMKPINVFFLKISSNPISILFFFHQLYGCIKEKCMLCMLSSTIMVPISVTCPKIFLTLYFEAKSLLQISITFRFTNHYDSW